VDKKIKKKIIDLHNDHPDWSDQHIADELKLTRSAVWRVTSKIEKYAVIDTTGWSEAEKQAYEEFKLHKKKRGA